MTYDPLTTTSTDMVSVRVEREERWCYERHVDDRLGIRVIAELAARPVDEGGLGYPLSFPIVSRRWRAYRAKLMEVESDKREDRVHTELETLAMLDRAALSMLGPIDEAATAKARARAQHAGADVTDPGLVILRDETVRARAITELRRNSESRRRLLGDDAPTTVNANVTVTDAATAELNAMLEEAGLPPIESEMRP